MGGATLPPDPSIALAVAVRLNYEFRFVKPGTLMEEPSSTPEGQALPMAPHRDGVFILLPVLNEIENIAPLINKIEASLAGAPFTIGILDDGSTDGTLEYLRDRVGRPDHHLHLICRKKTIHGAAGAHRIGCDRAKEGSGRIGV